jgi:SPP1 family predicted phage head-tail adaptor
MEKERNNIMRKRFEQPNQYDPGRFRHSLSFFQQVPVSDGSGGSVPSMQFILTTKAIKEQIKDGSQLVINAGASVMNEDIYFVIRNRASFYPAKDMTVLCDGFTYLIAAVVPIEVPCTYVKILCLKKDIDITT